MNKKSSSSEQENKSNRKILYSISILSLLLVLIASFYIYHKNYWPFNNEKVQGLPDQSIRAVDQEYNPLSLFAHQYGSFEMNYEGSEIGYRIVQYHNGETVKETKLGSLSIENQSALHGRLDYAITSDKDFNEESFSSFDDIYTQVSLSGMILRSNEPLDLKTEFEDGLASAYYVSEEPTELIAGNSIPLVAWSSGGIIISDIDDNFPKHESKNIDTYIVLYLDVE